MACINFVACTLVIRGYCRDSFISSHKIFFVLLLFTADLDTTSSSEIGTEKATERVSQRDAISLHVSSVLSK